MVKATLRHPLGAIRCALQLLAFACLFAAPQVCRAEGTTKAIAEAAHALCGKQIVLLGEADHGDGATIELKAALAQQLVSRCGFNAVYFEAGTYDFLRLQEMVREHKGVDATTLSSAIGALWNRDQELAPLVRFLLPRVNSGEVRVGGIDDQIGSVGAFYSLDQMPADLAAALPQERRSDCREQMLRRANYTYSEEHPHDAASIASLDQCLADVERRLTPAARNGGDVAADRLKMAGDFRRAISRDFLPIIDIIRGRDRRMYQNLRWLMARAGPHRKAIVWTASAHAAKTAAISDEYGKAPNLGTLVHQAFGPRTFALGISAAGGSHYWGRKEPSRPIPEAAPDSVETRALAEHGGDAVYVAAAELKKLGVAPGSFDRHQPRSVRWDRVFDGAVILSTERPPVRTP
jgi:erythromycin esterase-like protein